MIRDVVPMVNTVQWHPMLPDIIGVDVTHRYMTIAKQDGEFFVRSYKGVHPIKESETFAAIVNFYEQEHRSQLNKLLDIGLEMIVDFERQRLTLAKDGLSIIQSSDNTPYTLDIEPTSFFESKASTLFALHWLKNNTVTNKNAFDMAAGDEIGFYGGNVIQEREDNVLDFNQWREKISTLT